MNPKVYADTQLSQLGQTKAPKPNGIYQDACGQLERMIIANNRLEAVINRLRGAQPQEAVQNMKNPNEPAYLDVLRMQNNEVIRTEYLVGELSTFVG